jgi:hypothetical protein
MDQERGWKRAGAVGNVKVEQHGLSVGSRVLDVLQIDRRCREGSVAKNRENGRPLPSRFYQVRWTWDVVRQEISDVPSQDDEARFMEPVRVSPLPPRYEMLGEIGRGGMGIVYKVRDHETGEVLAVKVLKPESAANPQVLDRFKNGLRLAHMITHRHVARLYDRYRDRDPAARFQSIEEAMRALAGGPATAASPPPESARRKWIAGAAAVVVTGAGIALWLTRRPSDSVRFRLDQFTLGNGLRAAISPDHASPTFTMAVAYRAGLRRDTRGHAGVAHLTQHMFFQASPNVARNEYHVLVSEAGGNMDGNTTPDLALAWVTLPANQLELALFLEADRMRDLAFTQESLDTARASLLEERSRAMSDGYAASLFRFNSAAFDSFVNQQNGSPSVEELKRIMLDEVRQFYREYYTPSNAGLVLVGDVDPAKARERIRHHFEEIPGGNAPPPVDTSETPRTAEKRETVTEAGVPTPLVVAAWRAPGAIDPDWFVLKRLGELLGGNSAAPGRPDQDRGGREPGVGRAGGFARSRPNWC